MNNYNKFLLDKSIFIDQYFDIIKQYKNNPLKQYSLNEYLKNPDLYSEIHHIVPRWIFFTNGLKPDNSENNLVRVSYIDHIRLHILLKKYFEDINDNFNYRAACRALKLFYGSHKNRKYQTLSEDILFELRKNKIDSIKIESDLKIQNRKIKREKLIDVYNQYIANGFSADLALKFKNETNLRRILVDYNFPIKKFLTSKTKNIYFTYDEILKINKIFRKHGFKYLKEHYKSRSFSSLSDLKRAFKKFNLPIYDKYDFQHKHTYNSIVVKELFDFYMKNNFKLLCKKYNFNKSEIQLCQLFKYFNFTNLSPIKFLLSINRYTKKPSATKNRICINNGLQNKYILKIDAKQFLDNGWRLGAKSFSDEHKEKIRKASKSRKYPNRYKAVNQYSIDGIFIQKFDSIKDAIEYLKEKEHKNSSSICLCIKGKRKTAAGYIWKYA